MLHYATASKGTPSKGLAVQNCMVMLIMEAYRGLVLSFVNLSVLIQLLLVELHSAVRIGIWCS